MKIKTHYQLLKLITYSSPALLLGSLHAQESAPLLSVQQSQSLAKVISITFETFSLPANEVAKLSRLNISDAKMYEAVTKMVEENKAKKELFSTINTRNGEKMVRDATQAYRKNAESKTEANSKSESPEIKKARLSMEVEAYLGQPGPFIPMTQKGATLLNGELRTFGSREANPYRNDNSNDAALVQKKKQFFEAVREGDIKVMHYYSGSFKYSFTELLPPLKTKETSAGLPDPVIDVNVISTEVTLNAGDPFLLGTHTPTSKLKENDNQEAWLTFVTGTLK